MQELDYLKSQLALGKMSRRQFIGRAAALGMSTLFATSVADKVARAAPKRGGSLKLALGHGATTDSLDPATYPDAYTQTVCWGSMSNSLTVVDTAGNINPDLAESFEPDKGAATWVFRLRKGVTFHNGKSLTPADVVASFRHHMTEESKSAVKSVLADITDIKADGDANVVFTLKAGSADFPFLCSDYHIPIMPAKEDGTADWQSGVRTGPYVLEKFEPGVTSKLKRNPNYFRPDAPYFDEAEILSIVDVAARTNALMTGEVHYIDRCDLKTLNLLQGNPDIEITDTVGNGHYVFVMNTTQAPFDKPEVRNALKWALNRDDIISKVFFGHGKKGNDNPISPAVKFAIEPQPVYDYNVEKAKELLKNAGMEQLKVDLSVADSAFAGAVDCAQLFKEHAAAAGIEINVVREANDAYWDTVWMKKPFCASYWGGRPTADWMFTTAYAKGAAWNETFWDNTRFNELLAAARAETDDAKRAPMYAEMQQLAHDDGGTIVLVFNNYVSAHSKKLAHDKIAANWDVDGLRLAERWWFA